MEQLNEKTIITIGRQFGSGGRVIGQMLAERLSMSFYDRKIMTRAAQESGIKDEFFEKMDERPSSSIFSSLSGLFSIGSTILPSNDYLSGESLFKMQSETIRRAAAEGNCVFVGRCADYILRDEPRRFDIFISANMSDRIKGAMKYDDQLDEQQAEELIRQTDKSRAAFYNYYTDKVWGAASSYHLCINSSCISKQDCVDMIIDFIKKA